MSSLPPKTEFYTAIFSSNCYVFTTQKHILTVHDFNLQLGVVL